MAKHIQTIRRQLYEYERVEKDSLCKSSLSLSGRSILLQLLFQCIVLKIFFFFYLLFSEYMP